MKIMHVANISILLLIAAASTNVEARGRKFSCPLPDKRACMSASEVYAATHDGAQLDANGESSAVYVEVPAPPMPRPPEVIAGTPVPVPNRCCDPVKTAVTVKGDTLAVASPVAIPVHGTTAPTLMPASNRQELVVRTNKTEPFRVPAQVMRIFISPWEDESGDLHMGGYVFSEIAPRKWTVASSQAATHEGYRLLTSSHPSRDAAQEANTNKSDATAQVDRAE